MRTKRVFMNFFLFEYDALQQYLKEMARKGWMLNHVTNALMESMVFEECVPGDYNFYVDFTSDYDYMLGKVKESALDYRSFIEDYGYVFVASKGPMQIFMSEEIIDMPIREYTIETKKEMRKISLKSVIFWAILGLMWLSTPIIDILGGNYNELYFWTNNELLTGTIPHLMLGLLYLSFSFPVISWALHEKKIYPLGRIRLRSFFQKISVLLFIAFFINAIINSNTIYISLLFILYLVLGVGILIFITNFLRKFIHKTWLIGVVFVILLVGLCVSSVQLMTRLTMHAISNPYPEHDSKGEGVIAATYFGVEDDAIFEIYYEGSTFLQEISYNLMDTEDEFVGYNVLIVNEGIFHDYIINNVITANPHEEKVGKYFVYEKEYDYLIRDGNRFISVTKELYKPFTQKQLNDIFENINNL